MRQVGCLLAISAVMFVSACSATEDLGDVVDVPTDRRGGDGAPLVDALDALDGPSGMDATMADQGIDTGSGSDGASDSFDSGVSDAIRGDVTDVRPDVCVPVTEVCNGRDDNCDGRIDESGCPGHLLITEIVSQPNESEFIEIHNPTMSPIALDDVFITDFNDYARVIAATSPTAVPASDFVARFPAGATIAPGAYQTLATSSPATWGTDLGGGCPTYYLQTTATIGTCTTSRVMRTVPAMAMSIGGTASLTNGGEPVTLFAWNGASDLVLDLDYVYYGMPAADGSNPAVDKSMLSVDGPDPDSSPTGYALDTPGMRQEHAPAPALSAAAIRCDLHEGTETLFGGNGISGHNETSENLGTTWRATTPTLVGDGGRITMINATPNAANACP